MRGGESVERMEDIKKYQQEIGMNAFCICWLNAIADSISLSIVHKMKYYLCARTALPFTEIYDRKTQAITFLLFFIGCAMCKSSNFMFI